MDKKTNDNNIEREYIIPLRHRWSIVPRYQRANKAVKAVKEFLARHMKIRDRDLDKIRVDKYLNEVIWHRGIKNPPSKIKVLAVKEGDIVRATVVDMPKNIKFKKLREEKAKSKSKEVAEKRKEEKKAEVVETPKTEDGKQEISHSSVKAEREESAEKKEEQKENKASVIEAGKEMEKAAAKQMKHQQIQNVKEPKRPRRMTLQK